MDSPDVSGGERTFPLSLHAAAEAAAADSRPTPSGQT